jgi:hypothetical protein
MMRRVRLWLWSIVPHRHQWSGFAMKYGCTSYCQRCGRTITMMDGSPYGD